MGCMDILGEIQLEIRWNSWLMKSIKKLGYFFEIISVNFVDDKNVFVKFKPTLK